MKIKLGKKQLRILHYLAKLRRDNAETTYYYAPDWKALDRLREYGFIEAGQQGFGSMVTDKGRKYLASLC